MSKDIRVLLVDDHQVVREGLEHMLKQEEDIEVVGQSANGEEVLAQVEALAPNIVLMDIKMPGIDGIELTRRLKARQPFCNVIMLTLYDEYLSEAMEAGASGYLLKDAKRAELAQAIRLVHHGEVVISGSIAAQPWAQYEERCAKKAKAGQPGIPVEPMMEEVQMVIPPSDAKQLVKFVSRVEEVLQSRMLQMVGSWRGDTAIVMALPKPAPLAGILAELGGMPEVGTIGEQPFGGQADPALFKRVTGMPKLNAKLRKTVFVALKSSQAG